MRLDARRHDDTKLPAIDLVATPQLAPCRRHPQGAGVFGPQALPFVGHEDTASIRTSAPLTRIPVRATLQTSTTGCQVRVRSKFTVDVAVAAFPSPVQRGDPARQVPVAHLFELCRPHQGRQLLLWRELSD